MDYSCGKCFDEWICGWCKNTYCDDVCCPYRLEGKPEHEPIDNENKLLFDLLTETNGKNRAKIEKILQNAKPPVIQTFYLCKECKNKYIEHNVCKGRHKNKIERRVTNS